MELDEADINGLTVNDVQYLLENIDESTLANAPAVHMASAPDAATSNTPPDVPAARPSADRPPASRPSAGRPSAGRPPAGNGRQTQVIVTCAEGSVLSSTLTKGPWAPTSFEQKRAKTEDDGRAFEMGVVGKQLAATRSEPAASSQPGVPLSADKLLCAGVASRSRPASMRPGSDSAVESNLRVLKDLVVHGEAWKLGGSPQWRLLSDARVKEVLADFTLGSGTLLRVVPRLFRYLGQPEHERPYVGIIAQELPAELAPFCRFRTDLPPALSTLASAAASATPPAASPATGDKTEDAPDVAAAIESVGLQPSAESSPTGAAPVAAMTPAPAVVPSPPEAPLGASGWLYLVDLSALQFVLLNAANELQRRVQQQQDEIDELRVGDSSGLLDALSHSVRRPAPDYSVNPCLLVFNDLAVRRRYEEERARSRRYPGGTSLVLKIGTVLVTLVSLLTISSFPQARHLVVRELVTMGTCIGYTLLWHSAVSRRYPQLMDWLFCWLATLLVCVEVSDSCYLSNTHEANCHFYDEEIYLPDTHVGQDVLRWFSFVTLALPLIFGSFGVPWLSIVLSQIAVASFMFQYAVHVYTDEEVPGHDGFGFNCKILAFFFVPYLAVASLTYIRMRSSLELHAMAMREQCTAETFRDLYEAARIEAPAPPEAAQCASTSSTRSPGRARRPYDEIEDSPALL